MPKIQSFLATCLKYNLATSLHVYSTKLPGYMCTVQSYMATCLQYKATGTWLWAKCLKYKATWPCSYMPTVQSFLDMRLHAYGRELLGYLATCLKYKATWLCGYMPKVQLYLAMRLHA